MNKITIQDIRGLGPCCDPSRYLTEDWTGTVEDILLIEECPAEDRISVVLSLVPRFIAECFAIDCAVSAQVAHAAAYANATAYYYAAAEAANAAAEAAAANAAEAAAAYAAASASSYADAYFADSAFAYAKKQERENQIDALLMLLGGEGD